MATPSLQCLAVKILSRYILKEMLGPTFLGFLFYTAIILMQKLFDMAGMIIRRSLNIEDVGRLLLLTLPHIVVLTVPMAVLFGILIAVGRLSSDSEIIAMRALGISTRTIYRPVFIFSFVLFLLNLYLINYILPLGNQQLQALRAEILTSSVAKEIKPRVFYDDYDNLMIYVNDVDPRTGRWKGVFLADSRGAEQPAEPLTPQQLADEARKSQQQEDEETVGALSSGSGQRIITAASGNLAVHQPTKQIWMNLQKADTHVWDPRRPDRYDLNTNERQRLLLPLAVEQMPTSGTLERSLREMDLKQLVEEAARQRSGDRTTYNLARVEIHKKFAIPFACLAFGILGLPLGITNRRGGKSSGFSLSIAIILFYYVAINNGEQLAASGKIPPWLGMWGANIILFGVGIYLLSRANRDVGGQRSEGGFFKKTTSSIARMITRRKKSDVAGEEPALLSRLDITFPNTLDRYILREFLKVLALVLFSVMALFIIVDYNEIAKDVRANDIRLHTLGYYYRFQIFQVLNWTLPISVLVSTLVTFGILAKNNEITAIKSGGVSLYRVALPIIAVAMIMSVFAYFILDFVLPYSNRRVDELKRKIEGKPQISATSQQKLWFLGKGDYVINFLSYNKNAKELSQVQVFELAPANFRLTRRIYAQRARWNGQAWEFSNGWIRSFLPDGTSSYTPITRPLALQYRETPEDFAAEALPPDQMTFGQLRTYIDTIRKSGYSAEELTVRLYGKTSWPFITLVMALIALPFAFRSGKRGALYGVGLALILGITYWMIYALFTKFGEVGNLPPLLAAWSANILFSIAAIYMFLHVET
jgi:LPS export ABC transporter permease LptG